MDVLKNIAEGKYANKVAKPPILVPPTPLRKSMADATLAELKAAIALHEKFEEQKKAHAEQLDKHLTEEVRLVAMFKEDLEEQFGFKDHPKAEPLFRLAWDASRFSLQTLQEVSVRYQTFSELAK